VGEIAYRAEGQVKRLAVAWGFAEVLPNKVTILTETAEKAEEIDVSRAQAAKQKAEEQLRKAGPEGDPEAQNALQRATTRIEVAGKANSQSLTG
jgi:F-type H+-transporting ATPase subunit epsilon